MFPSFSKGHRCIGSGRGSSGNSGFRLLQIFKSCSAGGRYGVRTSFAACAVQISL